MSELDPAALRALEALRGDEPTTSDFARIAAKLEPRLVAAAPAAISAKLFALGGGVAAVIAVAAALFALSKPTPTVVAPPTPIEVTVEAAPEVKLETPPPPAPSPTLAKKKRAVVIAEPKTPEPEPVAAAPAPEPVDPADEELRILLEARRALTAHHPEKTLSLLESIESTKATPLAPERAATKLLALCALGRFDEAERGLENLGAAYVATVRQACDAAKR